MDKSLCPPLWARPKIFEFLHFMQHEQDTAVTAARLKGLRLCKIVGQNLRATDMAPPGKECASKTVEGLLTTSALSGLLHETSSKALKSNLLLFIVVVDAKARGWTVPLINVIGFSCKSIYVSNKTKYC